ncbi:GTD2A protein, partial [Pseudoatta argentina]
MASEQRYKYKQHFNKTWQNNFFAFIYNKTVCRKLKYLLASCSYFSLCLDESTNNQYVSQLSIFARIVQNDFYAISRYAELLDIVPLHDTFQMFSYCYTDDAKAMLDPKTGFYGQIRQQNFKFPVIHCIIHQEALCGKAIKLCSTMKIVTKIVTSIKGDKKFLSHRKFQNILEKYNAIYTDVPLHCEARWLISQLVSHIDSFRRKLLLFKNHLEENSLLFYPSCQILFEEYGTNCNFKKFIDLINSLISQLDTRFTDFKSLRKDLIFSENPCFFSKMKNIKIDKRSSLSDKSLSSLMRTSSSSIPVDISSLVQSSTRLRKSS